MNKYHVCLTPTHTPLFDIKSQNSMFRFISLDNFPPNGTRARTLRREYLFFCLFFYYRRIEP